MSDSAFAAPVPTMAPETNLLGIFFCNPDRFDFVCFLNVSDYDKKPRLHTRDIYRGKFRFNSIDHKIKDYKFGKSLGMGMVELVKRNK